MFRRVLSFIWALSPLLLGLPATLCFAWAARRLRSVALAFEAACYGAATVVAFDFVNSAKNASGGIFIALMLVSTVRALSIRRRLFFPAGMVTPEPPTLPTMAPLANWKPVFPASLAEPPDITKPATWLNSTLCTGEDNHLLRMPVRGTLVMTISGAVLLGLDWKFHIVGRGLGIGIGLLLTPLFVLMFSRRIDGSVLYYRQWGVLHRLPLENVTGITTSERSSALLLQAPRLRRPVSIGFRARAWSMPTDAREHLVGWLRGRAERRKTRPSTSR
ncbi:MAG TPA: hypothetical protein VMU99_09550 [Acidimicrobiales bacterium]|nr:hypothetical protein [Acidimicrobiales bacterium]